MHFSLPSLVVLAGFATMGLGAPAVPASQALTCDAGVCCDQFGGCVQENQLDPIFKDRIVNKRATAVPASQALTCEAGVCCDQFGGCVQENQLDPIFKDRIVNKRKAQDAAAKV